MVLQMVSGTHQIRATFDGEVCKHEFTLEPPTPESVLAEPKLIDQHFIFVTTPE